MRQLVTLLIALSLTANLAPAEENGLSEIRAKTAARLAEIAQRVEGTMGLVIADLRGDQRFAVNADRQFPQASAIKIPLLLEVLKQEHEGRLKWDDRHWVAQEHQAGGSGILSQLGDRTSQLSVGDLCVMMIVLSDNTATNMLIDLVGKENVTATMAALGFPQTKLQRRMMDTAASARGDENLSTPAEAAQIMRLLYDGKFIDRATSDRALELLRKPKPGAIKSRLPEGIPIAFKPGGIPGVATEWAIVELPERPYLVIAMGNYGVGDEFQAAMGEISEVAYRYFHRLARASEYGTYVDPAAEP